MALAILSHLRIYNVVRGAVELRDPSGRATPWRCAAPATVGVLDAMQGQPFAHRHHGRGHDRPEAALRGLDELAGPLESHLVYPDSGGRTFKRHLLSMPDVGDDADFAVPRAPARRVDV